MNNDSCNDSGNSRIGFEKKRKKWIGNVNSGGKSGLIIKNKKKEKCGFGNNKCVVNARLCKDWG